MNKEPAATTPADEPKPTDAEAKAKEEKTDASVAVASKPGEANGQTDSRRNQGRTVESVAEGENRLAREAATSVKLFEKKSLEAPSRQRNLRVPPALFVQKDQKDRLADKVAAAEGGEAETAQFGAAGGGGQGSSGARTEMLRAKNRRALPVVFVLVLDKSAKPAKPAAGPGGA